MSTPTSVIAVAPDHAAAIAHLMPMRALLILTAGMIAIAIALPAAGQTARPSPDDAVIQTAASGQAIGGHEAFRARVRDEMVEWRRKMQAFDQKVETGSARTRDAAEVRLRAAWDDTEVEARNVESATDRGWKHSRSAYDAASRRMGRAWDAVRF